MTAVSPVAAPPAAIPDWLVDAVIGLVASAYQAGRAEAAAAAQAAPPPQDVLDVAEACALLRCRKTKLAQLVKDGAVPSFTVGARRLFRRAHLLDYLESNPAAP